VSGHIYPQALAGLRDGTFDWTANEIKAVLLGPNFVYDSSKIYLDELRVADIIGSSGETDHRTFVDGEAKADPFPFLQLFSNLLIANAVIYVDTGDPAYSMLIAHYDSDSIIGAPKAADGEDEFLYSVLPPGYYFKFSSVELVGPINTYQLAGNVALAEIIGGLTLTLPDLLIDSRLRVHTHVVCANPADPNDCCEPTIGSSRCE
jgi:hypothetical protein